MPLHLAVAGLTAAEKATLVSSLKAQASKLSHAWTLHWDPDDFPSAPEALLYCPRREDGRLWASKLKGGSTLLIAALPPLEGTPSEVPLFIRMPFKPQETVDTLNVAAKRLAAQQALESSSVPAVREEPVELQFQFRGADRISSLTLGLFAIFHNAEKTRFLKIRADQGTEIWCWPDLDLYWSDLSEDELLALSDHQWRVFNCQGKREALSLKSSQVRPASSLLWHAGFRAFKTAEILPWFSPEGRLSLRRWPDLPKDARTIPLIRILARLTRYPATFSELISELRIGRKDLCGCLNALLMQGHLGRAPKDFPSAPPHQEPPIDPEETLFLRSLSLKCADDLESAIERSLTTPSSH